MSKLSHSVNFTALLLSLAFAAGIRGGGVTITDPKDKMIVDGFLRHTDGAKRAVRKYARSTVPEEHCWKTLPFIRMPLTAYHITGDVKYLDMFVENFEILRKYLRKGSDGFLGWYGQALGFFKHPKNPHLQVDVIITSFTCVEYLANFAEITSADPALKNRYAKQRNEYLDLAENHLVKKWTYRKLYVELGKSGAAYRSRPGLNPTKALLTKPANKHATVVTALTALHRATGEDEYMRMAVRVATLFKRRLTLRNGHYEWNYWDPAGEWDIHPETRGRWKMWIGLEHKGGYYAIALSQVLDMYHHGLVFDKIDLDRFLKTQLEATWNGDCDNPKWFRVDGKEGKMSGNYMASMLAPFSKKIEQFCFHKNGLDDRAKRASHGWQGGPSAQSWIYQKFIYLPAAKGGRQIYLDVGNRFRKKKANAALLKELEFTVEGSGYRAPKRPADFRE